MRSLVRLALTISLAHAACTDTQTPLSNATVLHCPEPGLLPFRPASRGFQKAVNQTIANDDKRFKDQASDTIGNPGGASASVYLADGATPAAGGIDYHGAKSRSAATNGFATSPMAGENVSLWARPGNLWMQIGRTPTDANGEYDVPSSGFVAANGAPVYAVLEADGSCAEHFTYLLPARSKVVVTDIDGTLTLSDNELVMQLADNTYVPKMMGAADQLTQAWANKGYPVIYLTARPHLLRAETRGWLEDLGFPGGPVITANAAGPADAYKTIWMNRMVQRFGWEVVAAYGNADTDITATENAQVPKAQTFIVGAAGGTRGTVAIPNNDFTSHITTYVAAQPANQ